ncbi:CPBP family intramembrane metalloprotease [Pseudomaricurvus alkylphenolicus]|uniref:CPBP family intramembrane glutamic endopeptidase n=1 Tax=Pseudomaricurvus alkylphenolicus TaxID=1306991 RepID=UPI00142351BA|nr:CPBP family intramembrane glutamic endopeptidase [Pseudomaricurvus alkylphenolicus]NIB42489.1 CPBP family intramembrane metalloprotease [Pseudomaricurvus alkylphenolicus]
MKIIRQYPFTAFYLVALTISTIVCLALFPYIMPTFPAHVAAASEYFNLNSFSVLIGVYNFGTSWSSLGMLFPLAPTIAAIALVLLLGGKAGLLNLLSRFKPWRGGVTATKAARVYLAMFVCGLGFFFTTIGLSSVTGGAASANEALEFARFHLPTLGLATFLFATFSDMGAVCEELGWRGAGYPLLLERFNNPLTIAIVLGLLWGAWHFPREVGPLMGGQVSPGDLFLHQISFHINTVAQTIVMFYVMNKLGGSIIPAVFIHGVSNYTGEIIRLGGTSGLEWGMITPFLSTNNFLQLMVALVIVAVAGPQLGLSQETREKIRFPFIKRS